MDIKTRLIDSSYDGLWALFLIIILSTAGLMLLKIPELPSLAENFQADSYDTMLSVKLFSEYGPFASIPLYSSPYSLFGNFPLLFAFMGSMLDLVINDASLSATFLYWGIELGIAALLWRGVLKTSDWRVRTAFVVLFLVNISFGNLFPLGFRKRQQLAILIGLAMFLSRNRYLQGALAFAAMLAQPITGAAIIFLKGADSFQSRDYPALALLIAALALSYPFYSGLISSTSLAPAMSGCGVMTLQNAAGITILLSLAFLVFFISNRGRLNALSISSAALALFYPLSLLGYLLIKDIAPLEAARGFLLIFSTPCNESVLQVSALGIAVLAGMRGFTMPRATLALILIASIISLSLLATFLIAGQSMKPNCDGILSLLDKQNASRIKTMEVVMTNHSGNPDVLPLFPFFWLQSYSMLNGRNVTFVDEFNLPPQLSKGASNVPMSRLPLAIYEPDADACREATGEIKSSGAQVLLFLVNFDFTAKPERGRFENETVLDECGLRLISASTQSNGAMVLIYRVA
jgi:hypothetical protein